jgi:cell wall-associated NlpC family hydrolase
LIPQRIGGMFSLAVGLGVIWCAGCSGSIPQHKSRSCNRPVVHLTSAPRVSNQHRSLDYWTAKMPIGQADRRLLTAEQINAINAINQKNAWGFQDVTAKSIGNQARITRDLLERSQWLQIRLKDGRLVESRAGSFAQTRSLERDSKPVDEYRVLYGETALHCIPTVNPLYKPPIDTDFDRNRCSSLHAGELVRILRKGADGWMYVHAGHSVGWVKSGPLTPPVTVNAARAFRDDTPRLVVLSDSVRTLQGQSLRLGTSLPLSGRTGNGHHRVTVPGPNGLTHAHIKPSAAVREGLVPLTRRNLWRVALTALDYRYGWGGYAGGRDCSRFLLDVFASFGIQLGRHSSIQARSGNTTVNVDHLTPAEKRKAIRKAATKGVVLLYMRGHIMLYLGEVDRQPYAVSALAEYMRPCANNTEQVVRLDRVAVTDLELGEGTERTAFIERVSRLAVFGQ